MIQVIGYIFLGIFCLVVFLVMAYVTAGIQMKSWLDVLDKFLDEKLKK